jgi:hypothetical protein
LVLGLLAMVTARYRCASWPGLREVVLTPFLLLAAFGVEGCGERLGFWHSTNEARLVLGLVAGGALSLILVSLTQHFLGSKGPDRVGTAWHYWVHLWGLSAVCLPFAPLAYRAWALTVLPTVGFVLVYAFLNIAVAAACLGYSSERAHGWARISLAGLAISLLGGEWLFLTLVR